MVRAMLRRTSSFTQGRINAKCTLQYVLAWTVVIVTVSGFFHLSHVHGFLKKNAFDSRSIHSSSKITMSLSSNVEILRVKVEKATEEIRVRLLSADAVETIDEALHQLRSERLKTSKLLVDIAAILDDVNWYLQQSQSQSQSQSQAQAQAQAQARQLGSFHSSSDSYSQPRSPLSGTRAAARALNATAAEDSELLEKAGGVRNAGADDGRGEEETEEGMPTESTDPLVEFFGVEEIRKYLHVKPNRLGRKNFMGANATFASIGHACVATQVELERYMDYEVGEYCADDWMLGQKLMVHGCDPLPRRRCFARGPKTFQKPLPINESLWTIPDDRNVRWDKYICKSFQCLGGAERKGFFKCSECFNMNGHEKPKWTEVTALSMETDFLLEDVLSFKPGQIRIGLDFSVGTGTFAARMREHDITIASATLNLGAPFNEFIALRGLLPLYLSVNQRLPFFDNTLDIVHSSLFLDGWIDHELLDFVLLDWDRVIRPGGLLWIDRFFCQKQDLDEYLYYFEQLRYKRLKWVVAPKADKEHDEMWFSAVLEKPPRPF